MGKIDFEKIKEVAIKNCYELKKENYDDFDFKNLDLIFTALLKRRDLFPVIKTKSDNELDEYIEKWIKKYVDAISNLPSKKCALPKNSPSDPALKTIVRVAKSITESEIEIAELYHNLFMSAENSQGNLLEEYIASVISDYGWIWCAGNIVSAIDFYCKTDDTFLQIKNKYNTENSSSDKIRVGKGIIKWYRLGKKTINKKPCPVYKWDVLNTIINNSSSKKDCNLNEVSYLKFLENVVKANVEIITEE